jgi:hypothetical protein
MNLAFAVPGDQLINLGLGGDQPGTAEHITWLSKKVGTIAADGLTAGHQCAQQSLTRDTGSVEQSSDVMGLPVLTGVVDR